ncbi:MAG: CrcB family protein [Actinomycetota bacterium]|nr:CrcB family protein [Actinomycetota bacterium]
MLAAVFLGGCVGGVARYGAVATWPGAPRAFPWSTLAVNLVGALVLAVVVVIAAEVRPRRYLRPLLGTGFCGALTTFSSVVVAVAQLLGEGRAAVAVSYLAANIVGGLATAALGLVAARGLAENRRRANENRSR